MGMHIVCTNFRFSSKLIAKTKNGTQRKIHTVANEAMCEKTEMIFFLKKKNVSFRRWNLWVLVNKQLFFVCTPVFSIKKSWQITVNFEREKHDFDK